MENNLYSLGFNRFLKKNQLINPYSIGPACFCLPSGLYTKAVPLDQVLMEYKNSTYDAVIDVFEVMAVGFEMLHEVGLQVRKNGNQESGDMFIPNVQTAVNMYPGTNFGNWINPSPVWTSVIGYDIRITNGDILRSYIYNESGKTGYFYIKFFGHYEKANTLEEAI